MWDLMEILRSFFNFVLISRLLLLFFFICSFWTLMFGCLFDESLLKM